MVTCTVADSDRRRRFWVTQPDACGIDATCGDCAKPGLRPIDQVQGRTIDTSEYVRGLALNILLTNGRKADTLCGTAPGTRGGHWSDSFRTGPASGSALRQAKLTGRISDQVAEIQALAKHDLEKLILYKVATAVDVTATYAGRNKVLLSVKIFGQDGKSTAVAVTGTRLENSWVWNR